MACCNSTCSNFLLKISLEFENILGPVYKDNNENRRLILLEYMEMIMWNGKKLLRTMLGRKKSINCRIRRAIFTTRDYVRIIESLKEIYFSRIFLSKHNLFSAKHNAQFYLPIPYQLQFGRGIKASFLFGYQQVGHRTPKSQRTLLSLTDAGDDSCIQFQQ